MSQGTTSPSKQLQFLDGLVDLVIMAIRETSDHSFDRRMQRFLYFFFFGGGGGVYIVKPQNPLLSMKTSRGTGYCYMATR